MKISFRNSVKTALATLTLAATLPTLAFADTAPLLSNAVIIDNAPFYQVGSGDGLGSFNYALNHPSFIDIPYAIFNFGSTHAVSNATLTWNFSSLYNSGPAEISLYAGNDADGIITTADRFNGSLVNTHTFSAPETRTLDVTSFVNASLGSGNFFSVRLEATNAPATLSGYYGGQFNTPSLQFTAAVPEPETYAMLIAGLGLLGFAARRRSATKA